MKQLKMKKQSSGYVFQDHDTIVYRAETTQVKNEIATTLRNAYGDVIVRITYTKPSGFRLFRGNKPIEVTFSMGGQEAWIQTQASSYQVQLQHVQYTFTCGNIDGDSCVVMMCDGEVLGRKKEEDILLKDALYSAQFCAFISFIYDYKDKVMAGEDAFRIVWEKKL